MFFGSDGGLINQNLNVEMWCFIDFFTVMLAKKSIIFITASENFLLHLVYQYFDSLQFHNYAQILVVKISNNIFCDKSNGIIVGSVIKSLVLSLLLFSKNFSSLIDTFSLILVSMTTLFFSIREVWSLRFMSVKKLLFGWRLSQQFFNLFIFLVFGFGF